MCAAYLRVLVRELALVADDSLPHPLIEDVPLRVHGPLHTERKLVSEGVQGAVLFAELTGKHRNHTLHHVHTCCAVVGWGAFFTFICYIDEVFSCRVIETPTLVDS